MSIDSWHKKVLKNLHRRHIDRAQEEIRALCVENRVGARTFADFSDSHSLFTRRSRLRRSRQWRRRCDADEVFLIFVFSICFSTLVCHNPTLFVHELFSTISNSFPSFSASSLSSSVWVENRRRRLEGAASERHNRFHSQSRVFADQTRPRVCPKIDNIRPLSSARETDEFCEKFLKQKKYLNN